MSLFNELKHRNVFRVAFGYIVSCWLLVQVADVVLENIGAPDWVMQSIMLVLALGFPVVVFFSWAYEVTPEGIKRESEIDRSKSITHVTGRKLDRAITAVLVIALAYFAYDKFVVSASREAALVEATTQAVPEQAIAEPELVGESEQSIAVLPFVNMSSDVEQEYFSDGISEEILNLLVKIPNLKVVGRTSSFAFKGTNKDLRLIGKSLNVSHILEGSVRRSGSRLRITAQLIRSDDGFHIWSETYDRELTDIFDIQDEISLAIADALAISMGIGRGNLLSNRTDDIEAYEAYLRARDLYQGRGEGLYQAVLELNKVIVRDPAFAPGWAALAQTYSVLPYYIEDMTADDLAQYLELAELAAVQALALEPRSSVATVALANSYRDRRQYEDAIKTYEQALELDPQNGDAHQQFAEVHLWLGHNKRGLELARKANELEPGVSIILNVLGWALGQNQQFVESETVLLQGIAIDSNMSYLYNTLLTTYLAQGRAEEALQLLAYCEDHGTGARIRYFLSHNVLAADETLLKGQGFRERASQQFSLELGPGTSNDMSTLDIIEFRALKFPYSSPNTMWVLNRSFWNEPRFKDIVKVTGQFAAWQVLGFPDDCRPIGDDDFECD